MNGYTLPNPFQAQEQKQPEYDFDKSLDALVAKRYDANKIVGIMTSAGFDSVQVAQALNQRYEAERQQQIIDNEAMKVELQKEKNAYVMEYLNIIYKLIRYLVQFIQHLNQVIKREKVMML